MVAICAALEAEIADLSDEDKQVFLADMGLDEPGLNRLIRAGYDLLGPADLLHRGPKGSARLDHPQGDTAPQAAGVIHTDFENGFIRAEVIRYDDYIAAGGEPARGSGQDAARRQGVRGAGRRRDAFPVQRLSRTSPDIS